MEEDAINNTEWQALRKRLHDTSSNALIARSLADAAQKDLVNLELRIRGAELEMATHKARNDDARELLLRHLNEASPVLDRLREAEKAIGLMHQDLSRLQDSVGATSGIRAHIDAMAERINHLEEALTNSQGKFTGAKATVSVVWVVLTFIISAVMWFVGFKLAH